MDTLPSFNTNIAQAIDEGKKDIAHAIDDFVITRAMETLGQRIKKRREELDLDQVELAKRVGFSQPTLANLESGKNERTKYLAELARELRTNTEWLATGKGDPNAVTASPAEQTTLRLVDPRAMMPDELIELISLYSSLDADGRRAVLDVARSAQPDGDLATGTIDD